MVNFPVGHRRPRNLTRKTKMVQGFLFGRLLKVFDLKSLYDLMTKQPIIILKAWQQILDPGQ